LSNKFNDLTLQFENNKISKNETKLFGPDIIDIFKDDWKYENLNKGVYKYSTEDFDPKIQSSTFNF
jgi:hypothetical protein